MSQGSRPGPPVGYNNLANWPDASNRPTLSGNVLTWIGPLNGGPSTVGDVKQSVTLTTLNDVITSSADNQVFQNLFVKGNATPGTSSNITHNNVIVRRCVIQNLGDVGRGFGGVISFSGNNNVIEDCLVDGQSVQNPVENSQNLIDGPGIGGTIVRRCNFINAENHHRGGKNFTVIDCWFHLSSGADADMCEFDGNLPSAATDNVILQNNSYDGRDSHGTAFLNSGVNMSNFDGPVTNITINKNRFIGTFNNVHLNDDNQFGAGLVTWNITSCGFDVTPRRIGRSSPGNPSPNTGNYILANINDHSGTLVNGTGAIT